MNALTRTAAAKRARTSKPDACTPKRSHFVELNEGMDALAEARGSKPTTPDSTVSGSPPAAAVAP